MTTDPANPKNKPIDNSLSWGSNVIPFSPNWRTYARQRQQRIDTKQRLIDRIGLNHHDAPLYDEYLSFMAYMESLAR